eukprot:scaffold340_cov96-Skeletonema_dohrnii-CCMP3373.AAC.1
MDWIKNVPCMMWRRVICCRQRSAGVMECKKHWRQFREISVLATTTKTSCPSRPCIPITGLGCPQRSK